MTTTEEPPETTNFAVVESSSEIAMEGSGNMEEFVTEANNVVEEEVTTVSGAEVSPQETVTEEASPDVTTTEGIEGTKPENEEETIVIAETDDGKEASSEETL